MRDINDMILKRIEEEEERLKHTIRTKNNEEENDGEAYDEDDFSANSDTREISFIELAMLNSYLYSSYNKKQKDFIVSEYGTTDKIGLITFGGSFNVTNSYWFSGVFSNGDPNQYIFQTKTHIDTRNELVIQLNLTTNKGISHKKFDAVFKHLLNLAFNNSEYRGKTIKVKLKEGRFKGIEILDVNKQQNHLILNDTQTKYINHFINRLKRGKTARYLLNGEPGTGKTETIREIARKLMPLVTFVIPEFDSTEDLTDILEACEVFDRCVIVMDDIDLYLGSRDNGSYTKLLGQFLSFFDGVKKRKISLLASTNDKGLVDKAAERPGRFNLTLDYGFLNENQIVDVCKIHLPEKWLVQKVYDALSGYVDGKKVNITGAFIANLSDNIKEMSEDEDHEGDWTLDDTISLIEESYRGFYSSQVEKKKKTMGFEI